MNIHGGRYDARLVAHNLLAVWQDNQLLVLDHTWDVAVVGSNQTVDLVFYQTWRVCMMLNAQSLDRELFSR